MSEIGQPLFSDFDPRNVVAQQESVLDKEIDGYDAEMILRAGQSGVVDRLAEKYRLYVPTLVEDGITQDTAETRYDARRNPDAYIRDRSQPYYIAGTEVRFHVPFDGDAVFFRCQPTTFGLNPPVAQVEANELVLSFSGPDLKPQAVLAQFRGELAPISSHLDCAPHEIGRQRRAHAGHPSSRMRSAGVSPRLA